MQCTAVSLHPGATPPRCILSAQHASQLTLVLEYLRISNSSRRNVNFSRRSHPCYLNWLKFNLYSDIRYWALIHEYCSLLTAQRVGEIKANGNISGVYWPWTCCLVSWWSVRSCEGPRRYSYRHVLTLECAAPVCSTPGTSHHVEADTHFIKQCHKVYNQLQTYYKFHHRYIYNKNLIYGWRKHQC